MERCFVSQLGFPSSSFCREIDKTYFPGIHFSVELLTSLVLPFLFVLCTHINHTLFLLLINSMPELEGELRHLKTYTYPPLVMSKLSVCISKFSSLIKSTPLLITPSLFELLQFVMTSLVKCHLLVNEFLRTSVIKGHYDLIVAYRGIL